MADFCAQCSLELFGEDFGDMAGLCPPLFKAAALCEDCGVIYVDHAGKCICDCDKHHYRQKLLTHGK